MQKREAERLLFFVLRQVGLLFIFFNIYANNNKYVYLCSPNKRHSIIMNKPFRTLIPLLVTTVFLTSCSKEEIIDEPVSQPQPDMEYRHRLVAQTNQVTYTPEEFSSNFVSNVVGYVSYMSVDLGGLTSEDIQKILETYINFNYSILSGKFLLEHHSKYNFIKQNFTYRSVRANGDSATFTGSVLYPAPLSGSHTLDGICLIHQYANANDEGTFSKTFDMSDIHAIFNQALVLSDTEGFGVDYGSYVPYFDGFTKGRQYVDAAIAAKEVLKKKGISFTKDHYSENIGVSLGGNAALGTQKYLESDQCPDWVEEEVLKNFSTFATDCPSSISGVLDYYCDHDSLFFPFTVPMMVSTAFAKNPAIANEYSYTDYFDPHANDRKIRNSKNQKGGELDVFFQALFPFWSMFSYFSSYGGHMKQFMNHSLFDEDGYLDRNNRQVQLLYDCLDKVEIANGWTPEHRLLMTHSPEDNVIPYSTAEKTVQTFLGNDGNVAFIPTQGDHLTATCISLISSCVFERPSSLIDPEFFNSLNLTDLILTLKEIMK